MIGVLKVFSVAGGVIAIGSISSGALVTIMPTVEAYLSKKEEVTLEPKKEIAEETKDLKEEQMPEITTLPVPAQEIIAPVNNPNHSIPLNETESESENAQATLKQAALVEAKRVKNEKISKLTNDVKAKTVKVSEAKETLSKQEAALKDSKKTHEETQTNLNTAKTNKTALESSLAQSTEQLTQLKDSLKALNLTEENITQLLTGTDLNLQKILETTTTK